ncbi:MAG: aminodeoxychorismate lyase [bacterium]|nr:aminodeoxychorismate lyase [bacterium]
MALFLVDPATGEWTRGDLAVPVLAADDLAATRGDGIFEAALVRGGEIRALDLHLERFRTSARRLDLGGASPEVWRPALLGALAEIGDQEEDFSIRWFLTRGREGDGIAQGWIITGRVPESTLREREHGISVLTLPRGYAAGLAGDAPWLLIGVKSLSYATALAATRFAAAHGAEDAIYVTTDGFVLEAPRSNVVIARGRELLTPDPAIGLLHGTTQRFLFERARAAGWECRYTRLRVEDLHAADAVWLVSSLRMAVRVHHLNGTRLRESPEADAAMAEFLA